MMSKQSITQRILVFPPNSSHRDTLAAAGFMLMSKLPDTDYVVVESTYYGPIPYSKASTRMLKMEWALKCASQKRFIPPTEDDQFSPRKTAHKLWTDYKSLPLEYFEDSPVSRIRNSERSAPTTKRRKRSVRQESDSPILETQDDNHNSSSEDISMETALSEQDEQEENEEEQIEEVEEENQTEEEANETEEEANEIEEEEEDVDIVDDNDNHKEQPVSQKNGNDDDDSEMKDSSVDEPKQRQQPKQKENPDTETSDVEKTGDDSSDESDDDLATQQSARSAAPARPATSATSARPARSAAPARPARPARPATSRRNQNTRRTVVDVEEADDEENVLFEPTLPDQTPYITPPLLPSEHFLRPTANRMSLWREDRLGVSIPKDSKGNKHDPKVFPVQLMNIQRVTHNVQHRDRYSPDEDFAMLIWMIRSWPLHPHINSTLQWRWAQQYKLLVNRTWDSMKSRAKSLYSMLSGQKPIYPALENRLFDCPYFVIKDSKIVGYNKKRVSEENKRSEREYNQEEYNNLPPTPSSNQQSREKRSAQDSNESEDDLSVLAEERRKRRRPQESV